MKRRPGSAGQQLGFAALSATLQAMPTVPALSAGASIGLLALSSPTAPERLQQAIHNLASLGFGYRMPFDVTREYGAVDCLFAAGSVQKRLSAFYSLLEDPEIPALLLVRGGYGAMELLPYLDWERVARSPKVVCGFSDATALLSTLAQRSGLPTIHGPTLDPSFAQLHLGGAHQESCSTLLDLLAGRPVQPFLGCRLSSVNSRTETVEGRVFGGNLSVLVSILGTPYAPNFDGAILFLEEVGERPYRVHRMLLQLKLAGVFARVRAVVFGSLRNCTHPQNVGPSIDDVLRDIFADCEVPVLRGLPAGHQERNLPIPFNVRTRVGESALELLEWPVLHSSSA